MVCGSHIILCKYAKILSVILEKLMNPQVEHVIFK
jgi:hypothetical protein